MWCIPPKHNAEFVFHMENVLEAYQRPYDPRFPLICMDELSKQLTIETQTPLPAKPGRPECFDYEYVRNGTGFIIRRNRFRAQMRSAMVLRASGLVENNQIDGVGGLGVYITNDLPPFPEGPVPRDLVVRGNTIRNTHYQGIHVGAASFNENMPPLARNVLIEGNFVGLPRENWPISLFSARDIVLKGNILQAAAGREAIVTRNCLGIRKEGNTIIRAQASRNESGAGRP